jgi:glycosyltransferase involved in cell wall biosynthesis
VRILHVLHSLDQQYGGPIRAVLDLSARSAPLGPESEIVGFGRVAIPDNPFPCERIHELPLSFPRRYGYSRRLSRWLEENLGRFDGVILHGMWLYPNWAAARACRKAHVGYVCFPHGMLEPWALYGQGPVKAVKKTLYWLLRERVIFRHATAVFFTTERERTLAQRTFVLPPSSFIVVPYGVDSAGAIPELPNRPELTVPANRKMALFLGRVHPKKNVDFLVEAWAKSSLGPNWELVIAGPVEPAYLRTLEHLINLYNIQAQVRFVGAVSGNDKSYLLGRASWFLLPSKQENFGISVLEAVNAGCPVAVSDQVYLSDYFHEKSEILPLQIDAWVRFLRDRMRDEQHRQALVRLDREFLVPKFSMDAVTRNWARTINAVFAKTG